MATDRAYEAVQPVARFGQRPIRRLRHAGQRLHKVLHQLRTERLPERSFVRRGVFGGTKQTKDEVHWRAGDFGRAEPVRRQVTQRRPGRFHSARLRDFAGYSKRCCTAYRPVSVPLKCRSPSCWPGVSLVCRLNSSKRPRAVTFCKCLTSKRRG